MQSFKILWLNWRCWLNPAMGGAEIFTHEVAKRWAESGHEVTLFTAQYPNCKKEETADEVKIVRSGGRYSVYRQAKRFYEEHFRNGGFDIVIDEINTVPFFAQNFVKKNEKVIALIHQLARQYWFYEMPFPISYLGYHFLEKRWLRQYVSVPTVTVSESTRFDLVDLGFKDLFVVPEGLNFVPLETLPEKKCRPIVIFSGRLKRAKRPDHAIRAFEIVKAEVPEAEMWVIGDGPFRSKLELMAGDGVTFFGALNSSKRRDLIKGSCVLVNPSVREGWGLNIVEANALGVPAVAYDVHGLRDSIKANETGLLAKDGCIEDLAEKTIAILKNDELSKKLSNEALAYSRDFSWNKTSAKFMSVVENCVGRCSNKEQTKI
jgi:glycosyltransferase involved in cell wall biosynthesis